MDSEGRKEEPGDRSRKSGGGRRGKKGLSEEVKGRVVRLVFEEEVPVQEAARRAGISSASAYKICQASGRSLPKRRVQLRRRQRDWVGQDFAGRKGPKIRPELAGLKTDFEVSVDTSHYRRLHGKEPEGKGSWVFSMGGAPQVEVGDFEAMRERVVKRAMGQGFHGAIVVRA